MNAQTLDYSLENKATAFSLFQEKNPTFMTTKILDELRESDYNRLDKQHQIYLDYTGGGLYASSQLRKHMEMLNNGVFGNPHSQNPTSLAMTELVEQTRRYVLKYFNASPEEYVCIFTANASGALKLVGEAYPFAEGGRFLATFDNHNSVNGIREFAHQKGAQVTYVPSSLPELRLDTQELSKQLEQAEPNQHNLFAYPAQSNFTGVQHSLEWIATAQAKGWDVLLDSAAFTPTNRLDLSLWHPDFVSLSFYKMFGYPTGLGCLIARKSALAKLARPWFAGGTITIVSVQEPSWHFLEKGEPGFEDGTVNYLNIPAIEIGLKHIESIGIDIIHERVQALTGWLLEHMSNLQHSNGKPLIQIYGPTNLQDRGGTIACNFNDPAGKRFDFRRVEYLANQENISLRTGCFCNPGTGELVHHLTKAEMGQCFSQPRTLSFIEFYEMAQNVYHKTPSTIRVSVGVATNFSDVYHFMNFAQSFLDKSAEEINRIEIPAPHH